MSLQPLMPALVALLAAAVTIMTFAAGLGAKAMSLATAGVFAGIVLLVAWRINRLELWPAAALADHAANVHATRRNTRLIALVYAWGGAVLLAVYSLSGLRWQHGWQYGSGMVVIASALLLLVHKLGDEDFHFRTPEGLRQLGHVVLAQAVAAAGGLVFLISSGKLWNGKQDWAANHVFLAGGLAIVIVSVIAWRTHRRLERYRNSKA